jgi:hypothetical protein
MKKDTEKILLLIHRIETLNSIGKVFDLIHHHYTKQEVPNAFENLDEAYKAQGDLYVIILSFLFSLFDKSGANVAELSNSGISEPAKCELSEVLRLWRPLCNPVTRIRHNLGFHGGKQKQMANGMKALNELETNSLLKDIVILIKKLCAFSQILAKEINYKT